MLLSMFGGLNLFHSPNGRAYAKVIVAERPAGGEDAKVAGHYEVLGLKSEAFESWLLSAYYERTKKAPSGEALTMFLRTLKAKACHEGRKQDVNIRVGGDGVRNYIDLGDRAWRVVEITKDGWVILDESPIAFRRSSGMVPLPTPTEGGSLSLLRPYVNVASDDEFKLLIVWLLASLRPVGPYPLLILQGEQGSAKSTTSRVLRRLLDPDTTPLRCEPKSQHDLMIAANSSWLIALDNLSGVKAWLSDALCRLATGGGFATRTLYSDEDETRFNAMRPSLLNGIDDVANRPDLLDRAVQLHLPTIPESERQEEATFWDKFEADQGLIFGALLDAYAGALKQLPEVELDRKPRMADFARFGEAVGRARHWGDGAFLRAYRNNIEDITESAAEASLVARAIRTYMITNDKWEGTFGELLSELKKLTNQDEAKTWGWPNNARGLASELARLAPVLRRLGFYVTRPKTKTSRGRLVLITKGPPPPVPERQSPPSQRSLSYGNKGPANNGSCDGMSGGGSRHETTGTGPSSMSHWSNSRDANGLGTSNDGSDGSDGLFGASEEGPDWDEEGVW